MNDQFRFSGWCVFSFSVHVSSRTSRTLHGLVRYPATHGTHEHEDNEDRVCRAMCRKETSEGLWISGKWVTYLQRARKAHEQWWAIRCILVGGKKSRWLQKLFSFVASGCMHAVRLVVCVGSSTFDIHGIRWGRRKKRFTFCRQDESLLPNMIILQLDALRLPLYIYIVCCCIGFHWQAEGSNRRGNTHIRMT